MPRPQPIAVSLTMLLAPLATIGLAAAYLAWRWQNIPLRYVSHWNAAGQPDGWTNRTPMGVYFPLLMALGFYVFWLLFMAFFVRYARRSRTTGPAGRGERSFFTWSLVIFASMMLLVIFMAVMSVWVPLRGSDELPLAMLIVGGLMVFVPSFACLVVLMRMGQGGSLCSGENADIAADGQRWVGDGTEDDKWLGGLIYFNRDDPAVMVQMRFGIGWTFNFARVATWIAIVVLLGISLTSTAVPILMVRLAGQSQLTGFVSDPQLIGRWRSVAFVDSVADFDPAPQPAPDDLFLKQLDVREDGRIAGTVWRWTRGQIHNGMHDPHPAHYEIRSLAGRPYLFFEWINDDVTLRGVKPHYYVLRRETPGNW